MEHDRQLKSPIQEEPSLSDRFRRAIQYLYDNARPQFHPALYVLLYAALFGVMYHGALLLLSLTPWFSLSINYELAGIFVGCISLAELVRGNVKHWHGCAAEDWCYFAMPFGGVAMAMAFWGLMFLMWGSSAWFAPLLFAAAGAAFYTFIGALLHLQAREQAKKANSA